MKFKAWPAYLLLLLLSFGIYFFYYHQLMLHLNAVLFKIEGDSIKNYYTFAYHIKNDAALLNFAGMNFPFGEHIIYTDCQPLLTFILRMLPFTHNYLIGIMHGLILLSFIITPLILYRIMLLLDIAKFPAFFSAIAITILSPQILRLGGHFALAYGCIIPLGILFLLNYFKNSSARNLCILFIYNSLLFLIHPYFGLGLSAFCFGSIVIHAFPVRDKKLFRKELLKALLPGIAPVFLFQLFMFLTDHHTGRPTEPYGQDIMSAAANMESVFTPSFGPFANFLKQFIKSKHVEWEALSYIGTFTLFLMVISLLTLPFYYKKIRIRKDLLAMFLCSLVFLVFAFGVHMKLLRLMGIQIATLNQFRAFGRFAWYFYFMLPLFLLSVLSPALKNYFSPAATQKILISASLLFFFLNLVEANALMTNMTEGTFKARNIFNRDCLSASEKSVLRAISQKNLQAILPLPLFHIGSEVYQRNGTESVGPAMLYSFHGGLPILGVMLSRTSLPETEASIEILNRYKNNRQIETLMTEQPLLVIKRGDDQKEDERRLLNRLQAFNAFDSCSFYIAQRKDLDLSAQEKNKFISVDPNDNGMRRTMIYIPYASRKPFTDAKIDAYEAILVLAPGHLRTGNYIASFHYHYKEKKYRYLNNNLLVEKFEGKNLSWECYKSVRSTSGFYDGYFVFEQKVRIDEHLKYRFLLNGWSKEHYFISDFLLRPDTMDVKINNAAGVPLYNNYAN